MYIPGDVLDFLNVEYTAEHARDDMIARQSCDFSFMQDVKTNDLIRLNIDEVKDELEFIRGDPNHYQSRGYVEHDYDTAAFYVNFWDKFREGEIPEFFPPVYDSSYVGASYHGVVERDMMLDMVEKFGFGILMPCTGNLFNVAALRLQRDNDQLPLFQGFVSSFDEVKPDCVAFVFNPLTPVGARNCYEIVEREEDIWGKFNYKSGRFRFIWQKDHGYYVVNSDVWSPNLSKVAPHMLCFSLVCRKPFFKLKVEPIFRVPALPHLQYEVFPDSDVTYDISNRLNRLASGTGCFMRTGHSMVYSAKPIHAVPVEFVGECSLVESQFGLIRPFYDSNRICERIKDDIFWDVYHAPRSCLYRHKYKLKLLKDPLYVPRHKDLVVKRYVEKKGKNYHKFKYKHGTMIYVGYAFGKYSSRVFRVGSDYYMEVFPADTMFSSAIEVNKFPISGYQSNRTGSGDFNGVSLIDYVYYVNTLSPDQLLNYFTTWVNDKFIDRPSLYDADLNSYDDSEVFDISNAIIC
jgi:hypothetical protein